MHTESNYEASIWARVAELRLLQDRIEQDVRQHKRTHGGRKQPRCNYNFLETSRSRLDALERRIGFLLAPLVHEAIRKDDPVRTGLLLERLAGTPARKPLRRHHQSRLADPDYALRAGLASADQHGHDAPTAGATPPWPAAVAGAAVSARPA